MGSDREPALAPHARELVCIAAVVIAIALPFANGMLAGPPAPTASIDLRFALVVGGAALGLLSVAAWRASGDGTIARRLRVAAVVLGLVPIALALGSPRDPFWASVLTLEVVLGAPLVVVGAVVRLIRPPGPRRGQRIALGLVLLAALAGPWVTLTWGLASVQLGIAPVRLAHQDPLRHANEEEIELQAADGTVLRGTYAPGRRGAGAVIIVHGIADGRTRMAAWSAALQERGYHTLRFDWRAHGRSEGAVTTFADRERLDLIAAFDWLAARDHVDATKISVLGTSMGAGVALASTRALAPRGLRSIVAFAPPSDYAAIVGERLEPLGPVEPLARGIVTLVARGLGHVSPLELSPAVQLEDGPPVPVLLFHGDADRTIPIEHSRQLAQRVPTVELRTLAGVGHDELPAAVLEDDAARRRVLQFLRRPRVLRDRDVDPDAELE